MDTRHIDFEGGVSAGIRRAHSSIEDCVEIPTDRLRAQLSSVLSEWPSDLSQRGVTLFAELATVASIARAQYGHAPIEDEELRHLLAHSEELFRCFFHR